MDNATSYAAGFAGYDAFLQGLMAAAPDIIVACDGDFSILSGNDAAQECLGRLQRAFLERNIDDFIPGLSAELKTINRGPFLIMNHRACRHNGDSFPVEIRGYAGVAEGETRYLLFICDITKKTRREEMRQRVRQLAKDGAVADDIVLERV